MMVPRAELISRYQSGESLVSLAISCRACRGTIRRLLRRAGVELRSHGTAMSVVNRARVETSPHADEIAARYLAGSTLVELGRAFKMSRPRLLRELKARGVALRTMSEAKKLQLAQVPTDVHLERLASARAGYTAWCEAGNRRAANGYGMRAVKRRLKATFEPY